MAAKSTVTRISAFAAYTCFYSFVRCGESKSTLLVFLLGPFFICLATFRTLAAELYWAMGLIGCVGLPEAPWLISILRTSLMLVDFDRDPKHRLWSFSHWRLIIRLRLV